MVNLSEQGSPERPPEAHHFLLMEISGVLQYSMSSTLG